MAMSAHQHERIRNFSVTQLLDENLDMSQFSEEERWKIEHLRMHEKHRGHEGMHAEMVLILLVSLLVGQCLLVFWKKHHFRSYQLVSMFAMWIIPLVMCVKSHWWRFIVFWTVYSTVTIWLAYRSTRKPLDCTVPRQVYKWFLFLDKLSYVLGIAGYLVVMATFLGVNLAFNARPHVWMDCGLLFIFYGLYYGVLGRDCSEICADRMTSHIGYYRKDGMPTRTLESNICALCGNKLLVSEEDQGIVEDTYRLSCQHVFHEFCIRGWCIVGKKQICPYCKEKVDLKRMFSNPWEKPHLLYGQLLDFIRILVAWQPLIFLLVQGVNYMLGLE